MQAKEGKSVLAARNVVISVGSRALPSTRMCGCSYSKLGTIGELLLPWNLFQCQLLAHAEHELMEYSRERGSREQPPFTIQIHQASGGAVGGLSAGTAQSNASVLIPPPVMD